MAILKKKAKKAKKASKPKGVAVATKEPTGEPVLKPCTCGVAQRADISNEKGVAVNAILTCDKCGVKKLVTFKTHRPADEITRARW